MPLLVLSSLCGLFGTAPFQCSGEPDPAHRLEETAPEALYDLAGRFRRDGDREGWLGTLHYLLERYPSSRFAVMAEQDLRDAGEPVPDRDR